MFVDTLGFLWTAWVLPTRRIPFRIMLPAAIVGGVCFEVLKLVGTFVIPRIVSRSSELYGAIGAVFALLVWFLVLGRVVVYVTLIEHESVAADGEPGGHGASRSMTQPAPPAVVAAVPDAVVQPVDAVDPELERPRARAGSHPRTAAAAP